MKKASAALVAALAPALVLVSMLSARVASKPPHQETPPQEVQKPKNDYMSDILLRNTQPLGLKENPATRRMMAQSAVKWSVRAGSRHILD